MCLGYNKELITLKKNLTTVSIFHVYLTPKCCRFGVIPDFILLVRFPCSLLICKFVFNISQAFLIMDGEDIPNFSSLKEETAYWKELSLKYKQR